MQAELDLVEQQPDVEKGAAPMEEDSLPEALWGVNAPVLEQAAGPEGAGVDAARSKACNKRKQQESGAHKLPRCSAECFCMYMR